MKNMKATRSHGLEYGTCRLVARSVCAFIPETARKYSLDGQGEQEVPEYVYDHETRMKAPTHRTNRA